MTQTQRPTETAYDELQMAADWYNTHLFDGQLPACLITFQRVKNTFGYMSHNRFVSKDGREYIDELALNPEFFASIPLLEILQTIVHELVHQWQERFGKPTRRSYHDRQFADKMESIGLMASDTGMPGGKRTGQKMGDYMIKGGRFEVATRELLTSGFSISWFDRYPVRMAPHRFLHNIALANAAPAAATVATDLEVDQVESDGSELPAQPDHQPHDIMDLAYAIPIAEVPGMPIAEREDKNRSLREKYTCPGCRAAVWGKPKLNIRCDDCNRPMAA